MSKQNETRSHTVSPIAIVMMGVSGSGKTVVGSALASSLNWPFLDGDDFHPEENVAKMAQGIPLTDADRASWLTGLARRIDGLLSGNNSAVIACSALKRSYRQQLRGAWGEQVIFVHLRGDFDLIWRRMRQRQGHFMKAEMLRSQFETLEEPAHAVVVDIDQTVGELVSDIRRKLAMPTS